MTKSIGLAFACILFVLCPISADAHGHHHHVHTHHSGPKDSQDPYFNPWDFPNCISWDPIAKKDVWVCGRYGY